MAQVSPLFQVSQGQNQGFGRAVFIPGVSGEEFTSKFIQVLGRIYFLKVLIFAPRRHPDPWFSRTHPQQWWVESLTLWISLPSLLLHLSNFLSCLRLAEISTFKSTCVYNGPTWTPQNNLPNLMSIDFCNLNYIYKVPYVHIMWHIHIFTGHDSRVGGNKAIWPKFCLPQNLSWKTIQSELICIRNCISLLSTSSNALTLIHLY